MVDRNSPYSSLSSCKVLLDDAISCMPLVEKQAFVEALHVDPSLVWSECDVDYILRFEHFHVWDAAKRITNYWTWKKHLFGERMLLPLFDLSGQGALDDDDIATLRTEYILHIPQDNDSNSVFVFDRSKVQYGWDLVDANRNFRVTFYCVALASEEQRQKQRQQRPHSSVTSSLIILNLVRTMPRFYHNVTIFAKIIHETSPIRLKVMHTLFVTQSDYSAFFVRMVIPAVDRNLRRFFPHLTLSLSCSVNEVLQKLLNMGLRIDRLPPSLGGTWQSKPLVTIQINKTSGARMDVPSERRYTLQQNSSTFLALNQQQPTPSIIIKDELQNNQDDITTQQLQIRDQKVVNDPLLFKFIQLNENNTDEAKKKLNLFTELRQQLFHNRLNLPVTLTQYGGLNSEDIAVLDTGFIMILPNDLSDNSVISLEFSKVQSANIDSIRRCYLYVLSVLTEQMKTEHQRRIVVFAFMNDIESDRIRDHLNLTDITEAFPVVISHAHIFIHPFGLGWFDFQMKAETLLTTILNIPEKQRSVHVLDEECRYDESFVVTFNLTKEHLPAQLGGGWTYEKFKLRQPKRIAMEYCRVKSRSDAIIDPLPAKDTIPQEQETMNVELSSNHLNSLLVDKITPHDVQPELIFHNSHVDPMEIDLADDDTIPILDDPSDCFSVNTQLFDEDESRNRPDTSTQTESLDVFRRNRYFAEAYHR